MSERHQRAREPRLNRRTAAPPPRPRPFRDAETPGETIAFDVRAVLCDRRSRFQRIRVLDLVTHGRALVLDDALQSAEADEHVYHEALVHPALLLLDEPAARVLILGGGEGATLREVLRHRSVKRAVMVDLDRDVVDACRRHLPRHHRGAFADPRAQLVFGDAGAFLRDDRGTYDAIVVDLVDPGGPLGPEDARRGGPAAHLYGRAFFRDAAARLAPRGLLALQFGPAYPPWFRAEAAVAKRVLAALRSALPDVRAGRVHLPSYHGAWGLAVAGRGAHGRDVDPRELDRRIARRMVAKPRTLDGASIAALLTLPPDHRKAFGVGA